MFERIKQYYSLTKPGVLYGNALTAAAGFLFASKSNVNWGLFLYMIFGTSLVIGSACIINNYLDQDIDKVMARTKKRALVAGVISPSRALLFGIVTGLLGIIILTVKTNGLVVLSGIFGFIVYVFLYGALSKRRSVHGTLVGSISGAMPIFAGYVAASSQIDSGAVLVFLVLFFWQIPEFYSISIYRQEEYAAANVPVISVIKGIPHTVVAIFIYTLLFIASTTALFVFEYTSVSYLIIISLLNMWWLWLSIKGLVSKNQAKWSRQMFRFSLIILLAFSFLISVDAYLP